MPLATRDSLPAFLDAVADRHGPLPCVEGGREERLSLTYAGLRAAARNAAARLAAGGVAPGRPVLLVSAPGPQWVAGFFGILAAGAVVVPVAADTTPGMIADVARRVGPAPALVSPRTRHLVAPAPELQPIDLAALTAPAGPTLPPALRTRRDDPAVLALTSGSTDRPRLVELTHGNLLANAAAVLEVRRADPGDRFLSLLPPAHLFELVVGLLAPMACGARIFYASSLLPNRIVDTIRAEGIACMLTVPALVDALYGEILDRLATDGIIDGGRRRQIPAVTARRLQSELSAERLRAIRSGLRAFIGPAFERLIVGAAAMDPALADIFLALGVDLDTGYGLTEAGPVVTIGRSGEFPPGSVGLPLPGVEIRLGERDEIFVRGPGVMRGYFGEPDATATVLHEGWLATGDAGRIDPAGFLYVTGRLKEAIVSKSGRTVHPDEMEPCYQSVHFAESCVAACPGPDGNDIATLFVVPVRQDLPDCDLQQIFAGLRATAPPRLQVERVVRHDRPLPRTLTGKVCRRLLVASGRKEDPSLEPHDG